MADVGQPLSFRQVEDLYTRLQKRSPELFGQTSLEGFSQQANEITGTPLFSSGLKNNFAKRLNADIDRFFDAVPLVNDVGEGVGRGFGSLFGDAELGGEIGRGLPRSLSAGLVGALAGLPFGGIGAIPGSAIGFGIGSGADAGLQTFSQTDSLPATLATGGITAALPFFGRVGSSLVGRTVARSPLAKLLGVGAAQPTTRQIIGQRTIDTLGAELGFLANNEAARQATNVALGQGLDLPGRQDLIAAAIGSIPGLAAEIGGRALFTRPTSEFTPHGRLPASLLEQVALEVEAGRQFDTTANNIQANQLETFRRDQDEVRTVEALQQQEQRPSLETFEAFLRDREKTRRQFEFIDKNVLNKQPKKQPSQSLFGDELVKTPANENRLKKLFPSTELGLFVAGDVAPVDVFADFRKSVGSAVDQPAVPQAKDLLKQSKITYKPIKDSDDFLVKKGRSVKRVGSIQDLRDERLGLSDNEVGALTEVLHSENAKFGQENVELSTQLQLNRNVLNEVDQASKQEFVGQQQLVATVTEKPIRTLGDFREVAELQNELAQSAQTNGYEMPFITDEWIAAKIQTFLDNGFPVNEAVRRTGEVARNKVIENYNRISNELTAKTQEKEIRQSAFVQNADERSINELAQTINSLRESGLSHDAISAAPREADRWIQTKLISDNEKARNVLRGLVDFADQEERRPTIDEVLSVSRDLEPSIQDALVELAATNNSWIRQDGGVAYGGTTLRRVLAGKFDVPLKQFIMRRVRNKQQQLTREDFQHVSLSEEVGDVTNVAGVTQPETRESRVTTQTETDIRKGVSNDPRLEAARRGETLDSDSVSEVFKEERRRSIQVIQDAKADLDALTQDEVNDLRISAGLPKARNYKAFLEKVKTVIEIEESGLRPVATKGGTFQKELNERLKKKGLGQKSDRNAMKDAHEANKFLAAYLTARGFLDSAPDGFRASAAALQAGADPADVSLTLPVTAREFFERYYKNQGLDPNLPEHKTFVDIATKVAAQFEALDKMTVADIVQQTSTTGARIGGVFFGKMVERGSPASVEYQRFVGLVSDVMVDNKNLDAFLKTTILGHEAFHGVVDAARRGEMSPAQSLAIDKVFEWADQLSADDKGVMVQNIFRTVIPQKLFGTEGFLDRLDAFVDQAAHAETEEFLAWVNGVTSVGLALDPENKSRIKSIRELFEFSDEPLREFMAGRFVDLSEMATALEAHLTTSGGVAPGLSSAIEAWKFLAKPSDEFNHSQKVITRLNAYLPDNWLRTLQVNRVSGITTTWNDELLADVINDYENAGGSTVRAAAVAQAMDDANEALHPVSIDELYGKPDNPLNTFMAAAQFGEANPTIRPIIDLGFTYQQLVKATNVHAMEGFLQKTVGGRTVVDGNMKHLKNVLRSTSARDALNKILLFQNSRETTATPADIDRFTSELSGSSKEDVKAILPAIQKAMQYEASVWINSSINSGDVAVARLIMAKHPDMRANDALRLGEQFYRATLDNNLPLLAQLAKQLGPNAFKAAEEMATSLKELHTNLAGMVSNRPWFTPENRGKFRIAYTDKNGEFTFTSKETAEDATRLVNSLRKQGINPKVYNPFDRQRGSGEFHDNVINHFVEVENRAYQIALKHLERVDFSNSGTDPVSEFRQHFQPGQAIIEDIQSQGARAHLRKRKLVKGREDLDVIGNVLRYIRGVNSSTARRFVKERLMLQLNDPEVRKDPTRRDKAADHVRQVLEPDAAPGITNKIKELGFQYFLGANLSTALIENIQPYLSMAPGLTLEGVGLVDGYKRINKAFVDSAKVFLNKSTDPRQVAKSLGGDQLKADALRRAEDEGVVDNNILAEFDFDQDVAGVNLSKLSNANSEGVFGGIKEMVSKPLYWYTHITRSLYSGATKHTSRIAFTLGYDLGREKGSKKGLTGARLQEFAYNEGVRFKNNYAFGGGKAGRPLAFGKLGPVGRSILGVGTILQNYNISMLSMLARMGNDALGRSGLPLQDVRKARKAFAQALTTNAVFGGALGIPFAGSIVALLEQIFPNTEINLSIRDSLSDLAGDDEELGAIIADAFLKGPVSAMTPIDTSSRFALGAVLGTSPYFGFNGDEIFGAGGSIFTRLFHGVRNAQETGNLKDAARALPVAWERVINSINDNGAVRDKSGNLLFEPSAAEQLLQLIGFQPKKLSQFREQQMLMKRHEMVQNRARQRLYEDLEQKLLAGNMQEVRNALLEEAQKDPTFDPRQGLRRVAEGAVGRVVPKDLTREGSLRSAEMRARIAGLFGDRPRTSEMQRLLMQKNLEAQVGIPGAGVVSPKQLSRAQAIDSITQSLGISPREAAAILDRTRL